MVTDFKQGDLGEDVSLKFFQQHSSALGAMYCIPPGQLYILIHVFCVCVPDMVGSSGCSQCTMKKSDAEVLIWETFKVAGYRVFLLHALREWSSRIKRYITGVLWRHSCSLHLIVMHVPNWLERKAAYNRYFCKISSSVYSWKVLCPVSPILLPPSEYSPFASFGGIFFLLKYFHAFPLIFERHVLLIILQQPQAWRRSTVFFHAHRVYCAWKLLQWMCRDRKSFSFFFFPSLLFFSLRLLVGKREDGKSAFTTNTWWGGEQ